MTRKRNQAVSKSIYDRIGGEAAIDAAVDLFYERVLADPLLEGFFERTNLVRLKKQQKAFFTTALGGPAIYKGRDMAKAHAHLKIEEKHFGQVANHLVDTLLTLEVPEEIITETIDAIAPLKEQIVNYPNSEKSKTPDMNTATNTRRTSKQSANGTTNGKLDSLENEIRELQAKFAAIDKVQAVIEFDLNGIILDANENFLSTMGYSLDEIVGQHHRMFVEPGQANSAEYRHFWESLNEGKFRAAEYKRIGKGGKEIWIQASYNPILDNNGTPIKVVKFATDVTNQKLKNADYQGQISAISKAQAVIEFNLDGTIIDANENFLATTGYSLDEIVGQHHRMFVDPEQANSAEYREFWEDLNEGKFRAAEYKRFGKRGKEIWIQASYNPILDLNGNPLKVVKFATDITETVKQRSINSRYASMSDNSPINIMFADRDLKIQYMNPASTRTLRTLEQHLPINADQMIGQEIDIFHKNPSYQRNLLADPKNLPRNAIIGVGPEKLDLLVSPIYDSNNEFLGSMVTWEVITKKLAAEQREKDMTNSLKKTMDTVAENAECLSSASEELSAISQQMSTNSDETANQSGVVASASEQVTMNVETVATSAEELSASVREIANNANEAAKIAATAVTVGNSTNKTISQLGESSVEIGKVIKVITSIAQQTNLLALNATIEAARAGEAGKGFAVVANEVKELAKQTANATEDISQKIEAIQQDTNGAVDAISEIGKIINQISDFQTSIASAVEEQSATTSEIARNASEASKGSADISKNIATVSASAKSTSEGASNTLASAQELSRLAADLNAAVEENSKNQTSA